MNVSELEQMIEKTVKGSDGIEKEPVYCIEYSNQLPFKSLRGSIIAQIKSCKRLLMKTKGTYERKAIEREILILILILELIEY
jgi:hypothetical protein